MDPDDSDEEILLGRLVIVENESDGGGTNSESPPSLLTSHSSHYDSVSRHIPVLPHAERSKDPDQDIVCGEQFLLPAQYAVVRQSPDGAAQDSSIAHASALQHNSSPAHSSSAHVLPDAARQEQASVIAPEFPDGAYEQIFPSARAQSYPNGAPQENSASAQCSLPGIHTILPGLANKAELLEPTAGIDPNSASLPDFSSRDYSVVSPSSGQTTTSEAYQPDVSNSQMQQDFNFEIISSGSASSQMGEVEQIVANVTLGQTPDASTYVELISATSRTANFIVINGIQLLDVYLPSFMSAVVAAQNQSFQTVYLDGRSSMVLQYDSVASALSVMIPLLAVVPSRHLCVRGPASEAVNTALTAAVDMDKNAKSDDITGKSDDVRGNPDGKVESPKLSPWPTEKKQLYVYDVNEKFGKTPEIREASIHSVFDQATRIVFSRAENNTRIAIVQFPTSDNARQAYQKVNSINQVLSNIGGQYSCVYRSKADFPKVSPQKPKEVKQPRAVRKKIEAPRLTPKEKDASSKQKMAQSNDCKATTKNVPFPVFTVDDGTFGGSSDPSGSRPSNDLRHHLAEKKIVDLCGQLEVAVVSNDSVGHGFGGATLEGGGNVKARRSPSADSDCIIVHVRNNNYNNNNNKNINSRKHRRPGSQPNDLRSVLNKKSRGNGGDESVLHDRYEIVDMELCSSPSLNRPVVYSQDTLTIAEPVLRSPWVRSLSDVANEDYGDVTAAYANEGYCVLDTTGQEDNTLRTVTVRQGPNPGNSSDVDYRQQFPVVSSPRDVDDRERHRDDWRFGSRSNADRPRGRLSDRLGYRGQYGSMNRDQSGSVNRYNRSRNDQYNQDSQFERSGMTSAKYNSRIPPRYFNRADKQFPVDGRPIGYVRSRESSSDESLKHDGNWKRLPRNIRNNY